MRKSPRRSGFTLVELLVVITIIAVLAGLAIPGINGALKKARQTAQVSDARNIGTLLFTYATDHEGKYNDSADTTALAVFQRLKDEKYLTDFGILYAPAEGKSKWEGGALANDNIAYGVAIGVSDASSDLLPLVFQVNSGIPDTPPAAEVDNPDAGMVTLGNDGVWKKDGVVVMYKGNNAKFVKADKDAKAPFFPVGFEGTAAIQLDQPSN